MEVLKDKTIFEKDRMFFATLVTYFIMLFLFTCIRVANGLGLFSEIDSKIFEVGFSVVSQILIMFAVPLVAMKFVSKQNFKKTAVDFGFGKTTKRVIGYAFLLGVLLYILNIFVAGVFNAILLIFGYRFSSGGLVFDTGVGGLLISIVLIGVLPGVCEETGHRGMLLQSFMKKLGIWRAVLITSLLFGLMHMNVVQVFYATILGYLIALAVIATRSIWTGVIMHFCNNAIGTYLQFARENDWAFGDILKPLLDLFSGAFGIILFALFIYFIYWLIMEIIHMFAKENYYKNENVYIARWLQKNPGFIKARIERGEGVSIEEISGTIKQYMNNLSKGAALRFYIDDQQPTQKMTVGEKTLLFGIIFFGVLVNSFTLIWGLL